MTPPETPVPAAPPSEPDVERLRREALDWLRRLTSGEASAADIAALDRWRARSAAHRRAFAEANLLWDTLEPVAREGRAQDAVPSKALAHASETLVGRRAFLGGATAAAALGAAAYLVVRPPLHMWPALSELAADYRTGIGEQRRVSIVTGVAVELNTRTSLSAPAKDGAEPRLELISGQIAVNMPKRLDDPIVVAAAGGSARTLGGRFDMRRDEDAVCVTCSEGSVEVSAPSSSVTLQPGQQVTYGAKGLGSVSPVDLTVATAWQRGLLLFRDAPLADVIDEVNRYRRGRIFLLNTSLGERKVVAGFRIDQIDDVIGYITHVFGANARSLPGGIVLLT